MSFDQNPWGGFDDPFTDPDWDYLDQVPAEPEVRLNPQQQRAVDHGEGPALVVAGAGSGKTKTLVARVVELLRHRALPTEILCVTFTRKAAKEMSHRISEQAPGSSKHLTISTFHSLCLSMARDTPHLVGREEGFTVWDDKTSSRELRRIVRESGSKKKEVTVGQLVSILSDSKQKFFREGCEQGWGSVEAVRDCLAEYEALKKAANALDFDDLLYLVSRGLDRFPDTARAYQEKWVWVMVDEDQDTNPVQEHILSVVTAHHRNLMVVGDEDQAIYGFRGAEVDHILTFTERYPDAVVIELGQNYRSSDSVVGAAARLISHNELRRPKRIWTESEKGWDVEYPCFRDSFHEADYIARTIKASIEAGYAPEEHAVLVRMRRQLHCLQLALSQQEVAYDTVGSVDFWQRSDVKLILSWLKVTLNVFDLASASEVFSRWPHIGAATVARWRKSAGNNDKGALASMTFLHGHPGCGIETMRGKSITKFREVHAELQDRVRQAHPVRDLVTWLYASTGIDAEIATAKDSNVRKEAEEAQARIELRHSFIAMCPDDEPHNGHDGISSFLDSAINDRGVDEKGNAVVLSTIHGSKGLEWDHVWVVGMVEGIIPSCVFREDPSRKEIEEERRLAYVAVTRSRKRLVLSRYPVMAKNGENLFVKPSRYLVETAEKMPEPDPPLHPAPSQKVITIAKGQSRDRNLPKWRSRLCRARDLPKIGVITIE